MDIQNNIIFDGNMDTKTDLQPIRCTNCNRKLGEVKMKDGIVSIKCKCGVINISEAKVQIAKSNRD